jgi:hypothetical protein
LPIQWLIPIQRIVLVAKITQCGSILIPMLSLLTLKPSKSHNSFHCLSVRVNATLFPFLSTRFENYNVCQFSRMWGGNYYFNVHDFDCMHKWLFAHLLFSLLPYSPTPLLPYSLQPSPLQWMDISFLCTTIAHGLFTTKVITQLLSYLELCDLLFCKLFGVFFLLCSWGFCLFCYAMFCSVFEWRSQCVAQADIELEILLL